MSVAKWEQKFREQREAGEAIGPAAPFVMTATRALKPGRALDLACGSGRNALWLARQGWNVTAVDEAPNGIARLVEEAHRTGLHVETRIADLEKHEFAIGPETWDLILICCYLQRDLFQQAKLGLVPGGLLIALALLEKDGEPAPYCLRPGELQSYFDGWEILSYREGSDDPSGETRAVAAIVARRPTG